MSVKNINELEVVTTEENITGEEKILMLQNDEAKLVPMNLIKGSSNGSSNTNGSNNMLIIDMSYSMGSTTIYDVAIGDSIKEAIVNGRMFCFYDNGHYMYPLYTCIVEDSGYTGMDGQFQLKIAFYRCNTNDITVESKLFWLSAVSTES